MRSRCLDRVRSARSTRSVVLLPSEVEALAEAPDESGAPDRARVRAMLGSLPRTQQEVLELGYFEGLSCSEIAERLALPIGTVKSRVAAALDKLRVSMHDVQELS